MSIWEVRLWWWDESGEGGRERIWVGLPGTKMEGVAVVAQL